MLANMRLFCRNLITIVTRNVTCQTIISHTRIILNVFSYRYSYNGEPVYLQSTPAGQSAAVVPLCVCGSKRTFEMQLMPTIINFLIDNTTQNTGTLYIPVTKFSNEASIISIGDNFN